MFFSLSTITTHLETILALQTIGLVVNIIGSIASILVSLVVGLILRRLAIRRLEKTVLDRWITETIGVLIIVLFLALGGAGVLAIWDFTLITKYLSQKISDVSAVSSFSLNTFQTLLLIALGIGIARTIKNLTIRGLGENHVDINIRILIGRIFYFLTLIIAVFWILSIWQVSFAVPVAVLGALTVALTVSTQDILKDLVAGFYILIERPFFIGDQISITSNTITYIGKVEGVQLRATKLRLITGEEVTVPNALVFGNAVINNTFYGERRAMILLTLPMEEFSREKTPEQITGELKKIERVMEKPEPTIMFSKYENEKITLTVLFWVASGQMIDISDIMYALRALLPNAALEAREAIESIITS